MRNAAKLICLFISILFSNTSIASCFEELSLQYKDASGQEKLAELLKGKKEDHQLNRLINNTLNDDLVEDGVIPAIGSTRGMPPHIIHTGNHKEIEDLRLPNGASAQVSLGSFNDITSSNDAKNYILVEGLVFRVKNLDDANKEMELVNILGEVRFVQYAKESDHVTLKFDQFIAKQSSKPVSLSTEKLKQLTQELHDFKSMPIQEQAASLTLSQSKASQSIIKDQAQREALYLANLHVLNQLSSGSQINIGVVSAANRLINLYQLGEYPFQFTGMLRGLRSWIEAPNQTVFIDLANAEIKVGSLPIYYNPSQNVISKVGVYFNFAKTIDAKSSLRDVLEATQRFIAIHPYIEGNGRTARLFLDHLLMKIGLPPVKHEVGLTSSFLFKTLDELEDNFLNSYL